ncbi:MAG TPA: hydroxyisourate hydrolase [Bacteroidia bacterium]|jgi:hydroxyisourate hydrolase|nr:hydroxyisourate hydrolase [Bacteroidia bacterium]
MSPITTHILDTSKGKPASGIAVVLEKSINNESWKMIGKGETNADGRVSNLLPEGEILEPGIYRLVFDTKAYFDKQDIPGFYPEVNITFETKDSSHYHVPLLLNPFGYSTYRGS